MRGGNEGRGGKWDKNVRTGYKQGEGKGKEGRRKLREERGKQGSGMKVNEEKKKK